ncbi:MAG: FAD-dependent oxidoreductase, partial [Clostridia bacterium]|nr:FAD-dependent oxidoreductase [Clostridia bacterium]
MLIVGGGVIGCAIARELCRRRLDVLLVDKEHDVALHASGRNDGMINPVFDLKPGELKRRY